MDLYELLRGSIPKDHSRQSSAESVLQARLQKGILPNRVLDFGCGDGRSIDLFRTLLPEAAWTGIDIEASPEVASRLRCDGHFVTYDGGVLPFAEHSFELVYSRQVLERVRDPELALREIARVMTPKGFFIGQTSQFEPYHSYSLWNFTVYGFKLMAETAGLKLVELRPGIDGLTLMQQSYEGRPPSLFKYLYDDSPLNQEIDRVAQATNKPVHIQNYRKLLMAGQFIFVLVRR